MRPERCLLMVVLVLALGLVTPVWAAHTADPLEEHYFAHVLPFYKVDAGWQAFAVLADTSFHDPATGCAPGTHCTMTIHLYFFDQGCSLRRDAIVLVSDNGVAYVNLNSLSGIPNEGVIFADTRDSGFQLFLAYLVLFNPVDNTTTRIESIPFSPSLGGDTSKAHWTRYDAFNTIAITLGDAPSGIGFFSSPGLPPPTPSPPSGPRTTLMFFNALGGGVSGSGPTVVGAPDTLREFMIQYGRPR